MSDSPPEDFMEQAKNIITKLKEALEASFATQKTSINESFDAQNTRINESFDAQNTRINAIATDYAFLKTDFEQHKNNHVSQSTVNSAIATQSSSHNQKLQNIKAKFISVEKYDAKIKEFEDRIATLEEKIKTSTPPIAQSEEGKIESKVPEDQIEQIPQPKTLSEEIKAEPGQTATPVQIVLPPSSAIPRTPNPDTSHQQPESKTYSFPNDPKLNDLQTDILKAILKSDAYTSINNKNRIRILNEAKKIISENRFVSDATLHMQVILALHYLSTDKQTCQTFYKNCYMGNPDDLQIVRDTIVPDFIGTHFIFSVNGSTFKSAIDDINFSTLINLAYNKSKTDDEIKKIINAIKGIKVTEGAN
jgi:hypothetical protein